MKKSYHILLSGGGTGGHIYPAIAIANELKARHANATILFVGAKDKMEMEKVPQAGYKIKGLWISGIQRRLTFKNLSFPFKLISSLFKAWVIVKQFKPDVVIGTGGFASGPTLYMASLANIPTLVQEQNSYPGITNKLLAKKADKICVAYSNLERFFNADKLIKTGNPVRQDLVTIAAKQADAKAFFKLDAQTKTLLVLGGSLGARAINKLVEANLELFKAEGVTVIWQCGKLYYDTYKTYNNLPNVQVHQFINNMALAYAAADIIVSRAGASSVSELCLVAKPVIFIPSPNVAEDHQTKNAKAVADADAAILLKETHSAQFSSVFLALLKDEAQQQKLSENIKKLALPNATKAIVDEIEKLIKN